MHKIKIVGWETPELAYGGPMVDYMAGKMNHGEMFDDGGELTPEELASLNRAKMKSKMALASEFGNPAARRMMNPTPPSYKFTGTEMFNGKPVVGFGEDQAKLGDTGTHRMGVMDNFAVPYIQQNPNGSLFYNQDPSPRDREAIRFGNPQDAEYFAEHYKEVAPMMKNYKNGGQPGPGPKKPFFPVSNFAEPKYVAGQNPEGHYGYSDNTIWYDPNSQIENVNNPWWMGHEQYHHYQKLSGKDKQGQRDAELDAKVDDMIKANPELQFVPRSKLIEGSKSFPGAEVRMYEDPNTVEGGARAYEQYIENGGKSIFPKGNNNSRNNYSTESAPLRQSLNFRDGGSIPKAKVGVETTPKCKPGQVYLEGTGCIDIASPMYKELYESGKLVQQLPDGKVVFPTMKPFVVNSKLTEDQKRALLRKDMLETSLSNQNQAQIKQGYDQSNISKIWDIATHPGTAIRAYNKKGYIPNNLGAVADNMGGSSSIINTLSPFTWAKGAYNAGKQFGSDPIQTTQDVVQGTGNLLAYGSHKLNESTLLPGQTMSKYKSPFGDAGTNERALKFAGNVADALPLLEFANLPGVRRFIKPSAPTDLGEAIIESKTFSRYNPTTKADEFYNANVADRLVPTRTFEDVAHKMKNLKDDLGITPLQDFFYKRIPKLAPEHSLEQGKGILFDPETGKLFDSNTRYWLNRQYGHTPSINSLLGPRGLKPISTKVGSFIENVKPAFKSEIDWGGWNSEIPANEALMNEYNTIEQTAKANNTWMKNADGSPYKGTPQQFVQENSENFKKAFPQGYNEVYRGVGVGNNDPDFSIGSTPTFGGDRGIFTADEKLAKSYVFGSRPNENIPLLTPTSGPNQSGVYNLMFPKGKQIDINTLLDSWTDINLGKSASKNNLIATLNSQNSNLERLKQLQGIDPLTLKHQEKVINETQQYINNFNKIDTDAEALAKMRQVIGDRVTTDDIAAYIPRTDLNNVTLRNIYDGGLGDVTVVNNKPGNYLKSRIGNNGMFNMSNPNVFKSMLPYMGIGAVGTAVLNKKKQGGVAFNQGYYNVGMGVPRFDDGGSAQCPTGMYWDTLLKKCVARPAPFITSDYDEYGRRQQLASDSTNAAVNSRLDIGVANTNNAAGNTVTDSNAPSVLNTTDKSYKDKAKVAKRITKYKKEPSKRYTTDEYKKELVNQGNTQQASNEFVDTSASVISGEQVINPVAITTYPVESVHYDEKGNVIDQAVNQFYPEFQEAKQQVKYVEPPPKFTLTYLDKDGKQQTLDLHTYEEWKRVKDRFSGSRAYKYSEETGDKSRGSITLGQFGNLKEDPNYPGQAVFGDQNITEYINSDFHDLSDTKQIDDLFDSPPTERMVRKEKYGGDISIPQLPRQNSPLLQFYYSKLGGQAPRNLMDSMVKPQKKRKLD